MGDKVGRVALFGIPLQQQWSYRVDGDRAPTYYLNSDAPLYYYSFTDASIAMAYKSLSKEEQARFDPMITGFNPDRHVRSGSYSAGIEDVSRCVHAALVNSRFIRNLSRPKISGEVASLQDQALDRLLDFAARSWLWWFCFITTLTLRFQKPGAAPAYAAQIKALFKRHPNATIIWAHIGVGRIVRPVKEQGAIVEDIITDPDFEKRLFRYLVGRSREIHRGDSRVNKECRRHSESLPGSIFVWYRRSRAHESGQISQGLQPVRAFMEAAYPRSQREGAERKLRAHL